MDPHPPYRHSLEPSDLHLFGTLKVALRDTTFSDTEEVKNGIGEWISVCYTDVFPYVGANVESVSYTHLDVYKRQSLWNMEVKISLKALLWA